jgi:formamidopyrimidine-DNA glycosylase
MPELPEVETIRRGLEQTIVGRTIEKVVLYRSNLRFPFPPFFEQTLEMLKIQGVSRQGKYLLIDFEGPSASLLIHLGMSGKVRLTPGAENPHEPHTHVDILFDDKRHLYYIDPRRFGFMRLMHHKHERLGNLGPEPLEAEFSVAYLKKRLASKHSPIKSVLLDQSIVAGLGNIYVLEALFRAEISPFRLSSSVDDLACERLVGAINEVLREAVRQGGSTLKDYKGIYGDGGYFQHRFSVYNRAGLPCNRCKDYPILCHKQSGRSTYYCGQCQA